MKVLIIGGGGREHALVWRLAKLANVKGIWASPGNPGIAQLATCIKSPAEISGYADMAASIGADLTVVGPEAPLIAGIVDAFRARNLRIVGPTQAAARLEGSKIFAKQFFQKAGIPTARSVQTHSFPDALAALRQFGLPVVIKADGLAAGKGVVVAQDRGEAVAAVQKLGPNLVIEEFLSGEEVSFIVISDGASFVPFVPTQDHKRAFDGDQGPNTGGMGAYADWNILDAAQSGVICERIIAPTLRELPFTGFLYAGLMITSDGPKILEYNVRMGDPETQAIMHNYNADFAELLNVMTGGGESLPVVPHKGCSVCITMAAAKYPESPIIGDVITGITEAEATGATVFHAGTKLDGDRLLTNGGRVLSVTAGGDTLSSAIDNAYRAAGCIHFDGMHYRKDIGQKGLKRGSAAAQAT